ncbi:MAG: ABC transporter ATP-binding protein [Balneolaceae bacterium]|nr:MAG: ABC transporter ATP-binding protein [Balneolaceae bacterium]
MLSVFKEISYYFSVFKKRIGGRIYIVFILAALAAATEALGIALLLPLIELFDSEMAAEDSAITQLMQQILNALGIGGSITGVLLFIGTVFLLKGVIKFSEEGYKTVLAANLQREIKGQLFQLYSTMDYRFYTKRNTGHFVNVIVSQVNKLIRAFLNFSMFLSEIIVTIAYLTFAFLISWEFATMAAVAGIFILFLFTGLNRYVKKLSRKQSQELGNLNKIIVQTLQSFKYISATAQFRVVRESVTRSIYKLTGYTRNTGLADAFTQSVREPVSVFVLLTIIIIQVVWLEYPLAPILVSLILINRAVSHIIKIQGSWQQTLASVGGLEIVEAEYEAMDGAQENSGGHLLPPFEKEVTLKGVSFSYREEDGPVLRNLNLAIPANSTIAFVGESGAGKTTLVDLLCLLLSPDEGELTIDGVPTKNITPESWRGQIGYVSQDTVVFDETIANNICMWQGDPASDPDLMKRIEEAAKQAFAHEFIDKLPEGYHTMVGDRGVRLSGGQKQRLFIARELFKQPRFLILDEATSALDSESERFIKESIDALKGKTTVVIIAHRLSTIRNADKIYVLDEGRVAEEGTYRELLDKRDLFQKMVNLQTL